MFTPSGMDDDGVIRGIELRLDTAIAGLTTAIPAGITQLMVGGVSYSVADLLKLAHEVVKPWKQSREAHAVIRTVSQNREDNIERAVTFLADLKASIVPIVGRESQELMKFGFKPQKRAPKLSLEKKTLRAAKAKATIEKRRGIAPPTLAANPAKPQTGTSRRAV